MYETDLLDGVIDLRKVTRITVVTDEGREFEKYDAYAGGVVLSLQDGGKTLKVVPHPSRKGEINE